MIPPGEAGQIHAVVKTTGLRGELSKTIAVRTNDPVNPSITLAVRAHVVGSVLLLPSPELRMRLGRNDGPSRLLVRKDPTETGTLAVADVRSSAPWLTVTARPVTGEEPADRGLPAAHPGDWILEVTSEGGSPGAVQSVSFDTGLSREKTVRVPVRVRGRRAIETSAASVELPAAPSGETSRNDFLATVRPGLDPAGLTVEATPSVFGARLEQAGSRHFRVFVTWTPQGSDSPRKGTLTLKIGTESLMVPLRVSGS